MEVSRGRNDKQEGAAVDVMRRGSLGLEGAKEQLNLDDIHSVYQALVVPSPHTLLHSCLINRGC